MKTKRENWTNRNGKLIPARNVPRHLKRRDATVERIILRVKKLRDKMLTEKVKITNEVRKYINFLNAQADICKKEKHTEGNVSLSDYANCKRVDLKLNNFITFDENLTVAKQLIDGCLRRWTKKSNFNLRSIIEEAFNVDKKGRINTYMILRLTRIEINDKDWRKAKELILQSMQVSDTKQYLSFSVRANKDSKWEFINLNFSSLNE